MQSQPQWIIRGQSEKPLAQSREDHRSDDQSCSNQRITVRRLIEYHHLPDKGKENVRASSQRHGSCLLQLQRQSEQDLAQEAEDPESQDEQAVRSTRRQTEPAKDKVANQQRVDEGKGAEVGHDDREVQSFQGTQEDVGVLKGKFN